MSLRSLLLVSSFALCACATTATVRPEVDRSSPDKAAAPSVKPAPEPTTPEPVSKAPVVVTFEDIGRVDAGPELADVSASFDKKLYFDGKDKLVELAKSARGASLDHQLQVLAMQAFADAMMGEPELALRGYRKVLAKWQPPARLAATLRRADPATGDARVTRAMDAFGEALFFLAERKREQVESVELPTREGSDSPADVEKFVGKQLKRWVEMRERRILAAAREYQRIDDIKPETPARWVVASHARQATMYAQTLQLLRELAAPDAWQEEGASPHVGADGQPLDWASVRAARQTQLAALQQPLFDKAEQAYQRCVDTAAAANVDDVVAKSCRSWLSANR